MVDFNPCALVLDDPFAFLLAIILDQGMVEERVWRIPYELHRRLGHLDPRRMVANPSAVRDAIIGPPPLHRYPNRVPGWILAAAGFVLDLYAGDAARIWNDHPTAEQLFQRFDAFPGVDQKKAAMAVEILERDLRVPVRSMEGSDIAYDVHVRRVFLRTGLADRDDRDHMIAIARAVHPDRPGALDNPAWMIGRHWCRPTSPDCQHCPIEQICPREIN